MPSLLSSRMNDEVTLYRVSQDGYGTKSGTSVGVIRGLLRMAQTLNRSEARVEEVSDASLFIDTTTEAVAEVSGQIQGWVVKAKKQFYQSETDSEDWYEITGTRVAHDHLLGNAPRFIRCSLQKIEPPTVDGTGNFIILQGYGSDEPVTQGYGG